ncbi:MAG: S41 family peptidase [Alphaproteobacteria bacterium]|nr:S41 family peptidase [Alphaproteobacteria bacterium]MBT5799145.1 S41 family peptidase [Alphaproteobacteria bacterium]
MTSMKRTFTNKFFQRGILVLTALTVIWIANPLFKTALSEDKNEAYRQLALFGDVFERVKKSYVEEVSDEELVSSAINGMLTSLDPHSSFLPEDNYEKMQVETSGKFGGLGVEITIESGFVKVVSPIDDTPAYKAGLQSGDYIISADEESLVGFTINEAVEKLRGPIGSEIIISIQRGQEEPFDVSIIRDEIKIQSVRSEIFNDVGYIRISKFSEQTHPGLTQAVKDLNDSAKTELKGYVLDLRNNPGGLLSQSIKVSDAFLEKGEIVSTRGRNNSDISHAYAREGDIIEGKPLVVLINSGSASASEIVAGALKDHKRAVVMGTRSFGKGSVQSVISMPGHGAIRLTTARYYTPSGISIQSKGITPDIEVELARIEELDGGIIREEDLKGALDVAEETDNEEIEAEEPKQSEIDFQLARAIDLIHGISIFNNISAEKLQ